MQDPPSFCELILTVFISWLSSGHSDLLWWRDGMVCLYSPPTLAQPWEVSTALFAELQISCRPLGEICLRVWDCGDIASACRNATLQLGQDRGWFELVIALADASVQGSLLSYASLCFSKSSYCSSDGVNKRVYKGFYAVTFKVCSQAWLFQYISIQTVTQSYS